MPSCTECGSPVEVPSDVRIQEFLDCGVCGVELEVIATDPVVLATFEEEEK